MKLYFTLKNILSNLSRLKDLASGCVEQPTIVLTTNTRLNTFKSTYVKDYVIAQSSIGTYGGWRKWNSGIAEYWDYKNVTVNPSSSYGGMYYVSNQTITYPSGLFVGDIVVNINVLRAGGLFYPSIYSTSTSSCTFYLASAKAEGSVSVWYSAYAIGRWK